MEVRTYEPRGSKRGMGQVSLGQVRPTKHAFISLRQTSLIIAHNIGCVYMGHYGAGFVTVSMACGSAGESTSERVRAENAVVDVDCDQANARSELR